jgi:preprotein translocase YajC subunit
MSGGLQAQLIQIAPIVLMVVLFYFMLIRPQQTRAKQHAAAIAAVKRGDNVVLSNGMLGKIVRVEDAEVGVSGRDREGGQEHDRRDPRQGRTGSGQRPQELITLGADQGAPPVTRRREASSRACNPC